MGTAITMLILLCTALYCGAQAYRDARRGDRTRALMGAACCLGLLLIPIPTHVLKIDLPVADPSPDR
jgi:hypothetical protein